jgi:hypothetical protein
MANIIDHVHDEFATLSRDTETPAGRSGSSFARRVARISLRVVSPIFAAEHVCSPSGKVGAWRPVSTPERGGSRADYCCPECAQHWHCAQPGDEFSQS